MKTSRKTATKKSSKAPTTKSAGSKASPRGSSARLASLEREVLTAVAGGNGREGLHPIAQGVYSNAPRDLESGRVAQPSTLRSAVNAVGSAVQRGFKETVNHPIATGIGLATGVAGSVFSFATYKK